MSCKFELVWWESLAEGKKRVTQLIFFSLKQCRGTVIQDNINPIAKVEKSALLLASTIYSKPAASLLAGEAEVERLTGAFPELLGSSSSDSVEIYQD